MYLEPQITQFLMSLAADLDCAGRGAKGSLVQCASDTLGRPTQWIYARLADLNTNGNRKSRNDQGQSKVSRNQSIKISNMMLQSNRDNGKQLMSLKEALRIASANGLISNDVSTSTVARAMKRYKTHPDLVNQNSPHRQVRSLYPNHVWQFDVSFCVLYYLKKKKGLQRMERDEFYKNKPHNLEKVKNDRVLRYLITDHYTGTFYVEYFNTPGESSAVLIEFLLNAFGKRANDHFHGVPTMLVWDAGTANESRLVKGMLERLQVIFHTHEVGSPRAKGQVERTHNLIECEFESRLSMHRVNSIEELNTQAWRWAKMYNSTVVHTRHNNTRLGLWQTIKKHQLRLRPDREFCKSLLEKVQPVSRKVRGDLTIDFAIKGYGSNAYSVECIEDICIGEKLLITYNPYRVPSIVAIFENLDGEKIHYDLEPVIRDEAGFDVTAPVWGENYRAIRDTPADTLRKEMNREAYGVDTDKEVKKARKARKPAFEGVIDPFADVKATELPDFMPRQGSKLNAFRPARINDVKLSYAKAVPRIRDSIGIQLGSEEAKRLIQIFKNRYPEGMPDDELYSFTGEMKALLGPENALMKIENGE